jgi:hypothetical protein
MALPYANSYDDVGGALREDLLDLLTNLSPKNTQLVSGLGTSTAKSIRHEWLVDTLNAVKANAQIEGTAITYHSLTNPARIANYCQIFKQGFKVSDTERAEDLAGFSDRYNYEKTKALALLKNDMEYSLIRGSLVSGSGTGARQLRGIKASLSLITAQSGVSMTEVMLNDYLQLVWTNTSTEVNAIYTDMYLKRKISGFTTNNTLNLSADDKRLVKSVDVYEADAAKVVKLFPHRYVSISGTDTNHGIIGIDEDLFKIAYLRKPEVKEANGTGDDFSGGNIVTELTLENRHYNAGVWADKLL